MRFGEKLDALISEKGTNQEEVGAVIGVHQTRVSQLTRGKGEVSRTQLIQLARFFGVSADWLGDDEMESRPSGFSPAEMQALKMVRELRLDEGEVIRRLCREAAPSRPVTIDEIEVRPLTGTQSVPPAAANPAPRRSPRKGA